MNTSFYYHQIFSEHQNPFSQTTSLLNSIFNWYEPKSNSKLPLSTTYRIKNFIMINILKSHATLYPRFAVPKFFYHKLISFIKIKEIAKTSFFFFLHCPLWLNFSWNDFGAISFFMLRNNFSVISFFLLWNDFGVVLKVYRTCTLLYKLQKWKTKQNKKVKNDNICSQWHNLVSLESQSIGKRMILFSHPNL